MQAFFTSEEVLSAKAEWKDKLLEFAANTNLTLQHARRLPIYEYAIDSATRWLTRTLESRIYRREHHTLVIAGDEHLQVAVERVGLPEDSLFLHQTAWRCWCSSRYYRKVCWWQEVNWAINCPYHLIDLSDLLASPYHRHLNLDPNATFLCSEEVADRGTHTILSIESDGKISSSPYTEWIAG